MAQTWQATVQRHDQDTGAGSLLADDGGTHAFDGAAFRAGGARLLRPGQRVDVTGGPGPADLITAVALPGGPAGAPRAAPAPG